MDALGAETAIGAVLGPAACGQPSHAADERDELAALQLIELHSIPASQTRIVRYRIGEAASGGMGAISRALRHAGSSP
jgi:hypothetical protein